MFSLLRASTFLQVRRRCISFSPITPSEFEILASRSTTDLYGPSVGIVPVISLCKSSVAIAVSGGPDSMALLRMLKLWTDAKGIGLKAFTVDHGLRAESSVEALQVQEWGRKLGVEHHVLSLKWSEAPSSKIMQTARQKRYEILERACRSSNIRHLFVGHQIEDQMETFILRLSRSSGLTGLACMANASPLSPYVNLVRPLLSISKARLIATCQELQQPFISDPTNANLKYARNNIRAALATVDASNNAPSSYNMLVPVIDMCREITRDLYKEGDNWIAKNVQYDRTYGFCTLPPYQTIFRETPEFAARILSRVLMCIGGLNYPPRFRVIVDVVHRLQAGLVTKPAVAGGCLIIPLGDGRLLICRENVRPGETSKTIRIGDTVLWDGRFVVSTAWSQRRMLRNVEGTETLSEQTDDRLRISRMTDEHWRDILENHPHVKRIRRSFPHHVRLSLPVVQTMQGDIVAVPHLRVFARPDIRVSAAYWPRQRSLDGLVSEETLDD